MFFSKTVTPFLSYPCVYPKNYVLKNEGDRCTTIGVIVKGRVEMHHYSETGEVSLLASLDAGDAFGDILIFSDEPYYIGTLITKSECEIRYLSKENLWQQLNNHSAFRLWYLRHMANKATSFNLHHKLLHQPSMQAKVLYYLHMMETKSKSKKVYIKSHQYLAQILNVQRPSLSRCLSDMKQAGLLAYKNHFYWRL